MISNKALKGRKAFYFAAINYVVIAMKMSLTPIPSCRLLSGIPAGSFGRWAFGVIILTHLVAYNECGSVATLVAVLIAMLNSLLMGTYDDNVRVACRRDATLPGTITSRYEVGISRPFVMSLGEGIN